MDSDSHYKQTPPIFKHRDSLPGRSFQMEVKGDSAVELSDGSKG